MLRIIFVSTYCAVCSGRCNFPVVDGSDLTWPDFQLTYLEQQPVIFTNLMVEAAEDVRWTSESLLQEYGNYTFDSSSISGNNRKGDKYEDGTSLREFLTAAKPNRSSWFLQPGSAMVKDMWQRRYMTVPAVLSGIHRDGPFLSLGRRGQSNGFHLHDHNWFAQLLGSKRWFVISKDEEKQLGFDPQADVENVCKDKRFNRFHCDLLPGQVIYVPSKFNHATCVRQGPSAAFAFIGSGSLTDQKDIDVSLAAKLGQKPALDARKAPAALVANVLCSAASSGNLPLVRTLVQQRASLDTSKFEQGGLMGKTPMAAAIGGSHLEVVKFLAKRVDITEEVRGMNVMHLAAKDGHLPLVQFFHSKGLDPKAQSAKGFTPAMAAAGAGHVSVLRYFIEQGVDTHSRDQSGMTILHAAAFHSYHYLIGFLHDEIGMDLKELRDFGAQHHVFEKLVEFIDTKSKKRRRKGRRKSHEL